jgi:hypothetical protein
MDDLLLLARTAVETRPGMGRVLVAKEDFGVGELVLRETPLLVWEGLSDGSAESSLSFLSAFGRAAADKQAAVLDMFHPPLDGDSARTSARRDDAALLARRAGMDAPRVHKLLLIVDSNAHQFLDANDSSQEQTALEQAAQVQHTALFERGSKISHSCRPNLEYNLKRTAAAGAQEHHAIRPIKADDELTDS